jgi:ubiquinone/menaquinone biosynthesis C-methylase UbiE
VEEGIWMLDVMKRPDAAAFDEQVLSNPIPLDLEKAQRLLAAGGTQSYRNANILDVGCGLGDLTHGLAQSVAISDSDIYAFDHSLESLRLASSVTRGGGNNRIHFSVQDALHLFFADQSFDLVVGSAVLHHFLDYPSFLREAARLLKPGATAIFAEPFFDGYFWPALFLKNSLAEHGLELTSQEFSGAATIIGLVEYMSRHRGNSRALEHMTDKHFFRESELFATAVDAGFDSVRFSAVAPPEFYDLWMPHFLDIYGVSHPEVRRSAMAQYDQVAALAGPLLPALMSHFKYVVLRKARMPNASAGDLTQ